MKNPVDQITDKVKKYAQSCGISLTGRILVGLSGGADSVALTDILTRLGADIVCVHVNHMIRGDEADRDEQFCRDLCKDRGIGFRAVRVDIPALAEARRTGMEETARDERRRILLDAAHEYGCGSIALAHNANDRAEMLIFNLCRGAGVNGLGSIRPIRIEDGINVIRPLLCLSKDEILSYLDNIGMSHVYDSTNSDTAYTRNYIRAEVLPALRRVNPSYLSNINRTAELCDEADGFICACAVGYLTSHAAPDKESLSRLHPAVAKKVFSLLYQRASGNSLSDVHLSAVYGFYAEAENGKRLQLPSGYDLICDNGAFRFTARTDPCEYEIKLAFGENVIEQKNCRVFVERAGSAAPLEGYINIYKIVKRIKISSAIIEKGVYIRNRRPSDSIKYGGMTHSVKDLLSEKKIPSSIRGDYPVICDGDGVLFVPPFAVRDGCRGDEKIYLTYCE